MTHGHRNEGITDHPCMEARATVQRWVLFQRDLTTKSAGLGSATFDSAGFGTNCTVGSGHGVSVTRVFAHRDYLPVRSMPGMR